MFEHDARGWLVSPLDESPEEYLRRIHDSTPFSHTVPQEIVPYREKIEFLIRTPCAHIPAHISAKGLFFWEPACCWVDDHASLQFHPSLFSPHRLSWLLSPYVIVAHEYVHGLRAPLNSKKYEEYIAYAVAKAMSTTKRDDVRCLLGPLFQSPKEIVVFFALYFSGLVLLVEKFPDVFSLLAFSLFYASCLITPFLIRLTMRWKKVFSVRDWVRKRLTDQGDLYSLLIRLSDDDIDTLWDTARTKTAHVLRPGDHWRWQLYHARYFSF